MAKIKSDAHLYLTATGAAEPAAVALTAITNAKPAVLSGVIPAEAANGDVLLINGTGEPLLDGYAFRIANLVAGVSAELDDFDGTRMAAAVAGGTFQLFSKTEPDGTLLEACMATITVTGQAPDSIQMDDMCGTATVLGSPKPPTFTFSGFVDQESPGFSNLWQASLESPKQKRWLLIDYTNEGGYIFGPVEIGEMTVTAGVGQGLQFSGSGVFKEVPTYSWALGPATAT
jgi:hypothetical protein